MADEIMERLKEVKKKYTDQLMHKANVVGLGIGYKEADDRRTDVLCIRVYVREKMPMGSLKPEDVIPELLDGIPTDVIATGEFAAH